MQILRSQDNQNTPNVHRKNKKNQKKNYEKHTKIFFCSTDLYFFLIS